MQKKVYHYLRSRPDLLHFVRMNPSWYRILTRNPNQVVQLEQASKAFYGKTFSHRVGKINQNLGVLQMLLSMSEAMKEQHES